MNAREFSDAMGELDTRYVDEVLGYRRKPAWPVWAKWVAAAACFCLILSAAITFSARLRPQESPEDVSGAQSPAPEPVTAPGLLALTVRAVSPGGEEAGSPAGEEIVMQEGVEIALGSHWNPAMSSRPGIPFTLSAPECPDAAFEVSADGGALLLWEDGGITPAESPFSAGNGAVIYWSSLTQSADGSVELYENDTTYIDIVIREGENIVGYAVVGIYANGSDAGDAQAFTYHAELLKSVSFPAVDGDYQNVTPEYVSSEIAKAKPGG